MSDKQMKNKLSRKQRLKEKFLKIDSKKHYSTTGVNQKKILNVQKKTLNNLY